MRLFAFSDLHRDLRRAESIIESAADADVVIGAGDFASVHEGLEETIDALSAIGTRTLLVPGNNETADALREAAADWTAATVLHGESAEVGETTFFGLGGGIPTTPWDWSFDLDDAEASELLARCPTEAVLALHSPPRGHCDLAGSGAHLGSAAIATAIERLDAPLAVCGHIHESWGERSHIGATQIANLGPDGAFFDLD